MPKTIDYLSDPDEYRNDDYHDDDDDDDDDEFDGFDSVGNFRYDNSVHFRSVNDYVNLGDSKLLKENPPTYF